MKVKERIWMIERKRYEENENERERKKNGESVPSLHKRMSE
jgi:hypothetical protein